jgi:mRNA-degrading endonuclease YafQ of YafQ-DinJ toxin-antitoxin module
MQITYTSEFKRNVRQLVKKYRKIRFYIEPVIEQLQSGFYSEKFFYSDFYSENSDSDFLFF